MVPKEADLDLEAADGDADQEYERLREQLETHVVEFADEHGLSFGELWRLLIDVGLSSRMLDYVTSVEQPSELGLKRDLDRFGREIDDFVRSAKRGAQEYVSNSKDLLEEMADEAETENGDHAAPAKP